MPQYTVTPTVPSVKVPEVTGGVVNFVIQNNLPVPILVGGFSPVIVPLFGDVSGADPDSFVADPFGRVLPYEIAAGGKATQKVFIQTGGGSDDPTDKVGGVWSLDLNAQVLIDVPPPPLPFANGLSNPMTVDITDSPEPSVLPVFAIGALALGTRRLLQRVV